jgi:hypothetical protein
MNLIKYVKAFFTSEKEILEIINFNHSYNSFITFLFAIFLIAIPSTFYIYNYVFNILLLGISITLITLICSFLISKLTLKENLLDIFLGNLNFISLIIFCNVFIIILMYLIGIPFDASSILISVAATLISTYYFIVILTYSFSLQIKNEKMKLFYELIVLSLWFSFVFFVLPLTI